MMRLRCLVFAMTGWLASAGTLHCQSVNAAQQVVLEGLRSSNCHGAFRAAAFAPNGTLYLLLDEQDGVRVLHTDASGGTLLGQVLTGTAGDTGVAMSIDPGGNLYVAGTTTSGTLIGTTGVTYPQVADSSTNSFVAKYDSNLDPLFLTFLGAGQTAASGVYATSDGVFVTGVTFDATFPVTSTGVQQSGASGSSENGFVESFDATGTLMYATYLTGSGGNTFPAAIVADDADNAYVTGVTGASGFPTVNALQPQILLENGNASGFLTKLNAEGSAFEFSTFIAGAGLTGLAWDAASGSLLLTGSVSLGQFPVATVAMPLTSAQYQTMVRVSQDGHTVLGSVLLTAGSQSFVTAGSSGDAWVSGSVGTPLFPGLTQPDYSSGDSFLLHVTAGYAIDQTMRLGGLPKNNLDYASMSSSVAAPAVAGTTVAVPGSVAVSVNSALLATERFDLPLVGSPTTALPNSVRDMVPASCGSSSVCGGSSAWLTVVSATTAPGLGLSVDDAPNVTVWNLGSAAVAGLVVTAAGYAEADDCGGMLQVSADCNVALSGTGPGSIGVSATGTSSNALLGASSAAFDPIVVNTEEVDFGIVTSVDGVAEQTVTVTNLSGASQTFASTLDAGPGVTTYTLNEAAGDCASAGATGWHALAAQSSCHVTLGLTASSASSSDGPVRAAWRIGNRDIVVTGFAQTAALNLSASEVDFGLQIGGGIATPRFLYLSNDSGTAIAHAVVTTASGSPFAISDGCPPLLLPRSVCPLELTYAALTATSSDSEVLTLDDGLTALVTGETLPTTSVSGDAANPALQLSTTSLQFAGAVDVTSVSSETQQVTLTNSGVVPMALSIAVSEDFAITNGCAASLGGGASCSVEVTFVPSQPGARQGFLSVTTGNGFAPAYVSLGGTGTGILPTNNGVLNLGQTLAGVPVVGWYQVQQSLPMLTVTVSSSAFGVALVNDTGNGHGTMAPTSFAQSATGPCANCWLGVQFLSQSAGTQSAQLTLSSVATGSPYVLGVNANALPSEGLVMTPAAQDFGVVAVGSRSGAEALALSNLLMPLADTTVQSVGVSGDFAMVANSTGGASCSGTLNATASCYVEVVFSPTAAGSRTGTLTVTTSSGTVSAALTGYGATGGTADLGLDVSTSALTFSQVVGGSATVQSVTLTNSGPSVLTIAGMSTSDPSFMVTTTCASLAPGASCKVTVIFTAQSAMVAATLSVPVSTMLNGQVVSSNLSIALYGNYTVADEGLEIVSNEVNYGASAAGAGATGEARTYTLNNLSGKALNVTLQLPRQFPLASGAACSPLAAGASCSFEVSYVPATGGAATGTVFAQGLSVDGLTTAQTLAYMLGYGVGTGEITITGNLIPHSPLSFGEATSGQMVQQTLTLANSGSVPVTVHRVVSEPPFFASTNCGMTLAVGAACTVTVSYEPIYEIATGSSGGERSDAATLTIESDAAASPQFLSLSGSALPVTSGNPGSSAVLAAYALSESALTFPNTQVGDASASQTVTLTNTGTTTLHLLGLLPPGDFTATSTCAAVLPGAACNIVVGFAPGAASTATVRTGALAIQTDAADALEFVTLLGSSAASPLSLSEATVSFGNVSVGTTATQSITITNTSGAPVTFLGVSATGSYSVATTCPGIGSSLAAGASCTLTVTFAPTGAGSLAGTVSIATGATQLPLTVSLTGTAIAAQLQVSPSALAFGGLDVGGSVQLTVTLTNTGTAALTGIAQSLGGTNAGEFAVTLGCGVTSLTPGQACSETVTFAPTQSGTQVATLTVLSSDPSGPATVALSGDGLSAPTATFQLSVGGGSSATATVRSGSPATYALTLTPMNGYAGGVALTCVAVTAGLYASCSLASPLLMLNGSPQNTTATISTLSGATERGVDSFAWLLALPLLLVRRRRAGRLLPALLGFVICGGISACGKSSATAASAVEYTPAGTYQYQVTASSTNGTAVSSTVTLNVVVQ